MDDEEKYYCGIKGEVLNKKYQIVKELGKGTFGTVYSSVNKETNKPCAIKILRAIDKYFAAGKDELSALIQIKQTTSPWKSQLAEVIDSFEFGGHLCIVFPLYGINLLELLQYNQFKGYNIDWTRELSKSFLQGIAVLHNQLHKIHSDIKPENVITRGKPQHTQVRDRVFVHPPGADLILIDLGSSIDIKGAKKPVVVCTRQYRPPEVMLGLEYGKKLDIWSCACVIYETLTGRTLFRTHNSIAHMCLIQKIIGPMPQNLFMQTVQKNKCVILEFYDVDHGEWKMPGDVEESEYTSLEQSKQLEEELQGQKYNIIHLLKWMLSWDPDERPTINQVLEHPFFNEPTKECKYAQTTANGEWIDAIQGFVDGRISERDFAAWWKQERR